MLNTKITRRGALGWMVVGGAWVAGCGPEQAPAPDGGARDAGRVDPARDGGPSDAAMLPGDAAVPDAGPAPDWRLPAEHWVPAKLPLTIIAPRPAAELSVRSLYQWAYPGLRYEAPVGVLGGAFPFHFELVEGPPGMTIGSQLVRDGDVLRRPLDYGVVSFTPPMNSDGMEFTYRVRVTDQALATAEVTVRIRVDQTKFVFVAPGEGGGAGTLSDPLRGFAAFYGTSATEARHVDKLTFFRGGDYTLRGDTTRNGNVDLGSELKSVVWLAYPGETPSFDCSTAKILFNGRGALNDCAFVGLRLHSARNDVPNAHLIWATSRFDRGLFWRNEFDTVGQGTAGDDNPSALFLNAPTMPREHLLVAANRFRRLGIPGGRTVTAYTSYQVAASVFEWNEAEDCDSAILFYLKGYHREVSMRGEQSLDGRTGGGIVCVSLGRDGGGPGPSERVEVSYCRARAASATAFRIFWNTSGVGVRDVWVYRCSFEGNVDALQTDVSMGNIDRCAVTDTTLPSGSMLTLGENEVVAFGSGTTLTGAERTRLLGRVGAELA